MNRDFLFYKLIKSTPHLHNVNKEFKDIEQILIKNRVEVDTAIDIACGDGEVTRRFQELLGIESIDGLDINPELVKVAKENGVKVIQADMNEFVSRSKYDIAIIYGSLHHSENKAQTLKVLDCLTKKYILIVDLTVRDILWHKITNNKLYHFDSTPYPIYSVKEIEKLLLEMDYKILDVYNNLNANFFHDRSIILATKI